jgi:hypothetical protein
LRFAAETVRCGIPTRLSPAWLVSPEADNPYNEKTRDYISKFRDTGVTLGNGNVVFPEGNAKVYLSEYFTEKAPENPYREDPCQIKCLSFEPNGDVLGDNFYRRDVMDIIRNYSPKEK